MTVYNGLPYLPLAVESIRRQTLRDFRFVIVNDGSTDGSADYLNALRDGRITVVHQENQGTGRAANRGLQLCNTDFIARIDADDIAFPTRLERQRRFLIDRPCVGLAGTQVAPLGEAGPGRSLALPTGHDAIYRALRKGHHALSHSAVMIRASVLRRVGGYWTKPLYDDWDMMIRVGEVSRLANLREVLHYYRVHRGSLNGSSMARVRLSIDYACELARRREQQLPEISPEDFESQRRMRPVLARAWEKLNNYALSQYRIAMADICGAQPLSARLRLAWAAACSPGLAARRVSRLLLYSRSSRCEWSFDGTSFAELNNNCPRSQ
jgi:glycosyltransferase involved in cell wall biosynthesis